MAGSGRPKADIWNHVKILDEKRVKCNYCQLEFAKSANRIKSHLHKIEGKGIRFCTHFPQSNNESNVSSSSLRQNLINSQGSSILYSPSNHNEIDEEMLNCYMSSETTWEGMTQQQVYMNTKTKQQKMNQVGPFLVSDMVNAPDLQLIEYVFESSLDECEMIFSSSCSFLLRSEFTTLKPKSLLNSRVIDIFADYLTYGERMKKNTASNWYLPVIFSTSALDRDVNSFLQFIERQKMREKYMSKLIDCEQIFIPVHIKKNSFGHFYLYMVHLKDQDVQIWDSLPSFTDEEERDVTTQKLLLALDELFTDDIRDSGWAFTRFHVTMAKNTPLLSNEYDCGIFVIHSIFQLANGERNPSIQFHSDEERLKMALQLLKSDLNSQREVLYKKAAKWYGGQDGEEYWHNSKVKRKNIDTCIRFPEDVQRGAYTTFDDSNKRVKSNPGLNDLQKNLDNSNSLCGLTKDSSSPRDHTKFNEKMLDCYMSPKTMWEGMTQQQQVQMNTKTEQQEMKQVGPFSYSNTVDAHDLQLIEYVFDPSEDQRFDFQLYH